MLLSIPWTRPSFFVALKRAPANTNNRLVQPLQIPPEHPNTSLFIMNRRISLLFHLERPHE
jgi:hypothetical protein